MRLKGKDPVAAALASTVSSMPRSETTPTPGIELANAKVKAWQGAARKGKGKDAPVGTMFGATWDEETFEIPHGEMDWSVSAQASERNPSGCLKNVRLWKNRRNMNARSLASVLGQWHPNLRAWIEVCPQAWQHLSLVSMRPWTCFPGSPV